MKWGLITLGWTFFGLFFASEAVVSRAYAGSSLRLGAALATWLTCAYVWLALTPLALYLARRFPLERGKWLGNSFIHLAASFLFATLQLAAYVTLASLLGIRNGRESLFDAFRNLFISNFHSDVLTYWAVIGLCHALDYYRKYREREQFAAQLKIEAAQLETRLARAQLDALRMQLHPHFLFNTLNSISVLMAEDVRAARRMLTRLSDLLRASFENSGTHEVSFREELEFLKNYLEIEETRFQDRLTVRWDVDPATLDARVPNLILQPLVENAIRHGIAPRASSGLVEIRARRENGTIQLEVRDNGPGLASAPPEKLADGIGLSNTRARLEQLYGTNHRFEMTDADGGGFVVTIAIPFRDCAVPGVESKK
ncbi:MAG TPA: histidine kinase [Pyrinomonadaceae bacterium]